MIILSIKDIRNYIISFQEGNIVSNFTDMFEACHNGYLSIIKYHDKNGTGKNWNGTMDWAARNGFLEIVKYLHEIRKEGCTESAMIWAVEQGDLDIVNYLYEIVHKKDLFITPDFIKFSINNDRLDIIKKLYKNKFLRLIDYREFLNNINNKTAIWMLKTIEKDLCKDYYN